jgi:hypothetical protein
MNFAGTNLTTILNYLSATTPDRFRYHLLLLLPSDILLSPILIPAGPVDTTPEASQSPLLASMFLAEGGRWTIVWLHRRISWNQY